MINKHTIIFDSILEKEKFYPEIDVFFSDQEIQALIDEAKLVQR